MDYFPFFGSKQIYESITFDRTLVEFSEGISDCPFYVLSFTLCNDEIPFSYKVFIDFMQVEWDKQVEEIKNGTGLPVRKNEIATKYFSFNYITDDATENMLQRYLTIAKEITLTGGDPSDSYTLIDVSIDAISDPSDSHVIRRMKFQAVEYPPLGSARCCDSVFPEPGTYEPGAGEPPGTDPCDGISASLGAAGTVLSLTVTGATNVNSVWKLNGLVIGNNLTSYNMVGYGVYVVNVTADSCIKYLSYEYANPCSGFSVSITRTGNVLDADVPDDFDTATYTWEYSIDGGDWVGVGAGSGKVITDAGFYRVTATDGDCTDNTIIEVDADAVCTYTIELTLLGDVLSTVQDPTDITDTFKWYVDKGAGYVLLPDTTASIVITESGYYKVEVTRGDCMVEKTKMIFVTNTCIGFGAGASFAGGSVTATATGCAEPTYFWYKANGTGGKILLGETTNVLALTGAGTYFLAVCCDGCEPKRFVIDYDGSSAVITDDTYNNNLVWGGV